MPRLKPRGNYGSYRYPLDTPEHNRPQWQDITTGQNVPLGIMFLKWIGIGLFFGLYFLYDACFVKPERDVRIQAQNQWDRELFNGWRLEGVTYDTEHGLYFDNLNGRQECTTVGYPGYPACPPQQYYVNGRPSTQVQK